MPLKPDYRALLEPICRLTEEAGDLIMEYYGGSYQTQTKSDASPVTDADIAANTHIVNGLKVLAPQIPIVSEEGEIEDMREQPYFWLVDPLDGTKSFVRGRGEFTVNIGLIAGYAPVLGAIYVPLRRVTYGGGSGFGAFKRKRGEENESITTRRRPSDKTGLVVSLSHFTRQTHVFLEKIPNKEVVQASSSVKFCVVAEGVADIYPRWGRTMEWDTAAGHAIVLGAGGRVERTDGSPLRYGKPEFINPDFIVYGE